MDKKFCSGFISIIGKTNVGKSTLMNQFVKQKIAITSSKPQTTRNKISGVVTTENYQMVFIDTPGFHKPKSKLSNFMLDSACETLNGVDLILFLVEPTEKISEINYKIIERLKNVKTKVFLVVNKIDTVSKESLYKVIDSYRGLFDFKEYIPISASNGTNVNRLLELISGNLDEGPKYFPDDTLTDQPERHLISEIIREKILYFLHDEIPHGVAVEITDMKKREGKQLFDVRAVIYCEKDSHKSIIIGKNGSMLKQIGSYARNNIESLLDNKIYLELWVKVKKNWRDDSFYLKKFGYM